MASRSPYLLGPEAISRDNSGSPRSQEEAPSRGCRPRAWVSLLVLEGETLVGCKQNRVVTRTVLVPANSTVFLEVGCMEQGRWNAESRHFSFGGGRMEGGIRRQTGDRTFPQRIRPAAALVSGISTSPDVGHRFSDRRLSLVRDLESVRSGHSARRCRDAPGPGRRPRCAWRKPHRSRAAPNRGVVEAVAGRTLQSLVLHDDAVPADRPSVSPARLLADVAERSGSLSRGAGLGWDVSIAGNGFAGSGRG